MTDNQNISIDSSSLEIDPNQYGHNLDIVISEEIFSEYLPSPSLASSSKKINKQTQKKQHAKTRETGRKQKSFWQPEEDSQVLELIEKLGFKWTKIGRIIGGRSGKQVRDRYNHSLNPNISKDKWTSQEDAKVISLYQTLGNKWCQIAQHLPGRTENQVKNRFYSKLKDLTSSQGSSPNVQQTLSTFDDDELSPIAQPEDVDEIAEMKPKLMKVISENELAWSSIKEPTFGRDFSGISHYFGDSTEADFESLGETVFRTIPSFSSEGALRDFSLFLVSKNSESRFETGSGFF